MLIRDPVHGDIDLDPIESQVLDFPELQRIRGIKQLGTAYLVYPGCHHSRFDHSLGTSHVAKRIVGNLRSTGTAIDKDLERGIVAAALLHDITHIPFGHTLEDERRLFARHDKGDRFTTLLDRGLAKRLSCLGLLDLVKGILNVGSSQAPPWAQQIVSSTIDADLMDYLRRDSYYSGLVQGYDDRIHRYFVVEDDQLAINMSKHGMERPDARSETIQLLRMRYFLTERVYYHHTKVIAGAMVSKAVEMAHEHGTLSEQELLQHSDGSLFAELKRIPESKPDPRVQALILRIENRDLLKRAYVLSSNQLNRKERHQFIDRYHHSRDNRHEAEKRVAHEIKCDPSEVIVYCPAESVMKEAAALVRTAEGLSRLNEPRHHATREIQAIEERYENLWRFYVFSPREKCEKAASICAEIFDYPSEHLKRATP